MNITTLFFNLSKYRVLRYFSFFLSYIYIYMMPLFLLFWLFTYSTRKMYAFSLLFLSSFSAWFLAELIKNIVRIPRPITSGLIVAEKGFSFPSQHASVTMIVGVVMYSMDKRIGAVLIVLSLLVGLSRVVLGVHYVVDIFAGWTVGILLGLVFIKIFSKI